jgi:plasmid stabilization system protein ParE
MRCRISRAAQTDVAEIWRSIAISSGSEEIANKVEEDLYIAMKKLGLNPRLGHVRAEIDDDTVRFWSVYSILIAYRIQKSVLVVVRVIHSARDLRKIFRRRRR